MTSTKISVSPIPVDDLSSKPIDQNTWGENSVLSGDQYHDGHETFETLSETMYHIKVRFVYCEELCRALTDYGCCPLDVMKKRQLTKGVSSEHLPYDLKYPAQVSSINLLLTEASGILARGRGSTKLTALGPHKSDQGPIFPSTAVSTSADSQLLWQRYDEIYDQQRTINLSWKVNWSTWHERGTKKNLSPRQEST